MTDLPNPTTNPGDLVTLAQWLAGDFSNYQQAAANPINYAHIRVFFRPLPPGFFPGIGFYSEQVYDYDLWTPYRQGIHQLVDQGDRIYIENYGLTDPMLYAGSARDLNILNTITPAAINRRDHCAMVFRREGDRFIGAVEGKECLIPKNGRQTYLDSYVEITANTWVSLDRGLDVNTHEQVWGSEHGPLQFEKRESFADEIPIIKQDS
ncbi:chromophore lyase CpcT/CpeT [Thalassoporum mexicanum]|nr:chromophore lyase CpcT/CpeT [Pseudanabaena sp. PCC 7367]